MSAVACGKQIGYVIADCVFLALGAGEARAALTGEAAEEIAQAAEPVISKLEQYIVVIADKEKSTKEVATAVFGVISTIWTGGCLGAVVSSWLGTLTLGDEILYGASALAILLAACATDGLAEIGAIAVELANAGWLVDDSIKCVDACSYA